MSVKIKISFTDVEEVDKVFKCLAPLIGREFKLKLPRSNQENGFHHAYLISKNGAKRDK